jgi:membrane-associated protein
MSVISYFFDFVLHMNNHLPELIGQYHNFVYVILFVIIFCETGLVITPFLPGDSLIFVTATLAATGTINFWVAFLLFIFAAVLGDSANYQIGHFLRFKVQSKQKIMFIKTEYLDKTHVFFEKHGGKTIIIARFMPIIRTFAPFVAGVGTMSYRRFLSFNIIGGISWVVLFYLGGFFFGKLPFVEKNFSLVVLAIIVISAIPAAVIFIKEKFFTKEIIKIGKDIK